MEAMMMITLTGLIFLSVAFVLWINSKSTRRAHPQRAEVGFYETYRLKFFIVWLLLDGELWLKSRQAYQEFLTQSDAEQESRQVWDGGLREVGTLALRFGADFGKDFPAMLASFEARYKALHDRNGANSTGADLRKNGKTFETYLA
jgi:hypothetical protein